MPKHFTPRPMTAAATSGRHPFRLALDDRHRGRPSVVVKGEPDELKLFVVAFTAFFVAIYSLIA